MFELSPGISFCVASGHVVLLDLRKDRYFRLPALLEAAFLSFQDGGRLSPASADKLQRLGVLSPITRGSECISRPPQLSMPRRSVIEEKRAQPALSARTALDTWRCTLSARLRFRAFGLDEVIAAIKRRAEKKRSSSRETASEQLEACSLEFAQARAALPMKYNCLRDSIALLDFLAPRGHFPTLVFGVISSPFAAHCWVQSGDATLNETRDRAAAFTPILVV